MQDQNSLNELDALAEELTLRTEVSELGAIRYYNENNEIHRVHGPAIIYPNGDGSWFQNGKRHRLDGPALTWPDGTKFWYINGVHCTEGDFNVHPLVIAHKSKIAL